jgi:hypothetical protein
VRRHGALGAKVSKLFARWCRAFLGSVAIGLLAGYIKCFGEDVEFDLTIAVRIAIKMGAYAGVIIAVLTLLTGTSQKK